MASENFEVLLKTQIDQSSISNLQEQINGLGKKIEPIKIKFDTSEIDKQIENVRKQISELNKIKSTTLSSSVSASGIRSNNSSKQQNEEIIRTYRELINLQQQINKNRTQLFKLDTSKDVKQINTLKEQIKSLEQNFNTLYNSSKNNLSNIQLDNLKRGFENTEISVASLNAKLQDTSALKKEAEEIKNIKIAYDGLIKIQKELNSTRIDLKGLDPEKDVNQINNLSEKLKKLQSDYVETYRTFGRKFSTEQINNLNKAFSETNEKIKLIDAKLQDTSAVDKLNADYQRLMETLKEANKVEFNLTKLKGSEGHTAEIAELENRLKSLKTTYQQLYDTTSKNLSATQMNNLTKEADNAKVKLSELSAKLQDAKQKSDALLQQKNTQLLSNIDLWCQKNSAALKMFGNDIERIKSEVKSCNSLSLNNKLSAQFKEIDKQAKLAGVATQTFGDRIKSAIVNIPKSLTSAFAMYFNSTALFTGLMNGVRGAYEIIKDIDSAMTELKKVTDETDASYSNFLNNAVDKAKEIGTTIDDYITSTADFARLGYTFDQSQELAKVANVYNVVGDGLNGIEDATQSVVSTMKAFDIQAENSISIVDKYNEVSNNFSVSSGGLGQAMKDAASSLATAGNDINESIAMVAAANEIVQDPSKVGNGLRTIALRLRGMDTELEELGEDTSDMIKSVPKLREEILAMSNVDILKNGNTMKSTFEILDGIADKWKDLSDLERASLTEDIAGKNRANIFNAMMQNWDQARNAMQTAMDSEGSAMAEHAKWMDSIEAKTQKFTASLQALAQDVISSDFIKSLVDTGTGLIDVLDSIIDKFGLLTPLAVGLGTALSFKNVGRDKMFSLFIQSLCVLYT